MWATRSTTPPGVRRVRPAAAVDQFLRDRWAALERAEARLATGSSGARSAAAGRSDERLEADSLAELTVEAAAEERGAIEESDGAVGLVSASHQFEVLNDADITPEEQLADEEDEDESAPTPTQGLRILRDDQLR